jgi:hypothetical protein
MVGRLRNVTLLAEHSPDPWQLLTLLIAALVLLVQFRQYRTDRAKFKLDLFEKRFAVFVGTRRFLSQILTAGKVDLADLFAYRAAIGEAEFLYKTDITEYLREIDRRALNLHTLHGKIEPIPVGDERSRVAGEISDELGWLIGQLPELKDRFAPYLGFASWR